MIESALLKVLLILGGCGVVGSLVGFLLAIFNRNSNTRVETAMGVGFLVGAGLGTLFAVFESIAGRL